MSGKYKKILKKYFWKGSKKYFTVFYLSAFLILVSGIVSPVMIESRQQNWEKELNKLIASIETSVTSSLKTQESDVLKKSYEVKNLIRAMAKQGEANPQSLIESLAGKDFRGYSVEVFNGNEDLIAWTDEIAIPQERFFPILYDPGEVHFFRSGLYTYLTLKDTIRLGGRIYYESVSLPVEKYYRIQNDYYRQISLTDKFTSEFLTPFEIDYSPIAQMSLDGRKYSIPVENSKNHQIAVVTFLKPARDLSQANLRDFFIDLQSILAIAGLVGLLSGFYSEIRSVKSRLLKSSVLIMFTVGLRFALFFLEVPAKFFEGPLTNASFFASAFGFGIVKSPLEFFITVIFALFICVNIYGNVVSKVKAGKREERVNLFLFVVLTGISVLLYLVFLRGLGASIRSVIFDSSLRYFREPGLIPDYPAALMQLNVLLLGMGAVLIAVSILLTVFFYIPSLEKGKIKKSILALFIIFQASGIIYDLAQHEPQGTPLIRVLFLTFTFVLSYKVYFEEGKVLYNYVYFALVSSLITISLLNYYNSSLEKESLKTTAYELTRASDEWLEFLVREALINSTRSQETIKALKEQGTNFETTAFMIWSQSSLQREAMRSSVTLLDREKRILGSFGVDINPVYRVTPMVLNYEGEDIQIFNNYKPEGIEGKIISGIVPIKEDNVLLGYIVATVLFNPSNYKLSSLPPFLASNFNSANSTVSFEKLKVFEFENDKLKNVYGDITPADTYTKSILYTNQDQREAWTTLRVDDENYTTYILREIEGDSLRTIAVLLREKTFSWSLYNFLKVFFIHSIFIIVLLLSLYGTQLRKPGFIKYTFRAQLLGAFLFISLLPLIFMAFYNRSLTEEKNRDLILLKLGQNSSNLENYVKEHLKEDKSKPLNLILSEASRDLNLDFSLYSGKRQIFSTREEYSRAGLVPEVINPSAFSKLFFQGYTKYDMSEEVEDYSYNSIYSKVTLDGMEYVLKVSDMFNKISLPITGEEVDIFLFGSYFFATILVIIISTLLANRISSPIRGLTRATISVAGGDLNFEVRNKQKGEIRDLVNGFNSMIKELRRSQAELAQMERESAWKEMARQVAHEIKNPLTPMKLAVQQLMTAYKDRSPKFDAIFDKVSRTIINQIDTLSNIASEFSGFARMPNLKMEKVDIREIIQEACDLYVEGNVKIAIEGASTDLIVEADRDQLKRTIINLIRNSIQAGATEVGLKAQETDGEVINLEISDNGRGIPGEFIERIFEPNFTTKQKGMGLGLKIAKKFMEGIGGSISIVESSEKGTRILLQFKKMR
ncbi:MAG: HAMP domain-containing protein [Ignavibacteria bacterium]|jgi:signal transduction histidine kinase|nr:HAMP domain-containing protein [Ignavibacteria bacterium]MCU7503143.1 HAMP domain-containing protein [Ignavibacteria bacterium]MCU7518245.1 HAMP domain-containing protein [Ignavibacteria bacterium]